MDSLRISGALPAAQASTSGPSGAVPAAPGTGSGATGASAPGTASAADDKTAAKSAREQATGSASAPTAAAAPAAAKPAARAIGTQMVLVFDDQTRSMTIKILDIETQKVQQPLFPDAAPASASGSAQSGPPATGTLINTKA
jgi:hypothetical protein